MGSFRCWYRRTRLFSHVLTCLTCLFQEETSVRTNIIDACICMSLPVTRRDPGGLFRYPMVQEARSLHTFLYKRACTYARCDVL